jgi:hypothetical protein
VRWDPLRETNPSVIDTSFFDEDKLDDGTFQPELYYMAVLPTVPDTQPPSAPGTLTASGSIGSASLSWGAAVDDVGVTGYDVYRSTAPGFTPGQGNRIAQPAGTAYTDGGPGPGTYYYRVAARDAAGNVGPPSNEAAATVIADTTPPTVAITAPAAGSTVSGTVAVTADASDNGVVAGVQFLLDGSSLGAEDTSSPWSVSWATNTAANGSHVLTARARDAAGNAVTSAQVAVTVGNATGGAVLLGDQTLYSGGDSDSPGTAEAFRTTAVSSGTLARLVVYVDTTSTATSLVVGVYADRSGHPGSLLAQATAAPANGAWNAIAVPAAPIASGSTYWIALLAPKGTLRFRDRSCGCANPSETSAQTTLTTLPASWTTGVLFKDAPASAYGT